MKDEKSTFHHVMECSRYRDMFLTYVDDLLQTALAPDPDCEILDSLYAQMEKEYRMDYGDDFWQEMVETAESIPDVTLEPTDDLDLLRIPAEHLDLFIQALFGSFEGQIPSLGEENPLVMWESTDAGEFYLVPVRDFSNVTMELGEIVSYEAGTYYTEATLYRDGKSLGTWSVNMEDYRDIPGQPHIFDKNIYWIEELTD